MAERPCDCGVLCLRPKSSFVQLSAVVIRQAGPAQNVFVARSAFFGGGSLSTNISQGRGHRPPTSVGVRKLE